MPQITNLFGESPFGAIKAHSDKVQACIGLVRDLFQALERGETGRMRELTEQVIALETEADAIQNSVHEHLVSKLLLPVSKGELFNILEQQDSMADKAEEIAAMLSYRDLTLPGPLMAEVHAYVERILHNCSLTEGIMSKLDLLVESSFGGRDALTVSRLISELNRREDETKAVQIAVTRKLLAPEHGVGPVESVLWMETIKLLAELSKYADHAASAIRRVLEVRQ